MRVWICTFWSKWNCIWCHGNFWTSRQTPQCRCTRNSLLSVWWSITWLLFEQNVQFYKILFLNILLFKFRLFSICFTFDLASIIYIYIYIYTHIHTHTQIYIYIYILSCVGFDLWRHYTPSFRFSQYLIIPTLISSMYQMMSKLYKVKYSFCVLKLRNAFNKINFI